MQVKICNANNFDVATIQLNENTLNIKFAHNGTGKSTIARAIEATILNDEQALESLTPFKYINDKTGHETKVEGVDALHSVMVFNEQYVNEYVFTPDDLVKGTFDIFIKTPKYDEHMANIATLLRSIANVFHSDEEIDTLIGVCHNLSEALGKSGAKGYTKSCAMIKGLGNGNLVENIPSVLAPYAPYLKCKDNIKWLKWQSGGNAYRSEENNACPYCASQLDDSRERIETLARTFTPKNFEHLVDSIDTLSKLSEFLSQETADAINAISTNISGITDDDIKLLVQIRIEADDLKERLEGARYLNFDHLKNVDKVADVLGEKKINGLSYIHFQSDRVQIKIAKINEAIDGALNEAGKLQGEVMQQKKLIESIVEKYNVAIHDFLKDAGYNYKIEIRPAEEGSYKMVLLHNDAKDYILPDATRHLSYGERNALALALFVFVAVEKRPDLIILDDPISSFDGLKKFSLLKMMFLSDSDKCFRKRLVLMLTHDLCPIIDALKVFYADFSPVPNVSYLECSNGVISEKEVARDDLQNVRAVAENKVKDGSLEMLLRLVYLRRRIEIDGAKDSLAYQLLSSILHGKSEPTIKESGTERAMTAQEIDTAQAEIKKEIAEFSLDTVMMAVSDKNKLKELYGHAGRYEKTQLFRIVCGTDDLSPFAKKFVNESFHIEDEYLFQLDPVKYNYIPDFVVSEMDRIIGGENVAK